MPTFPHEDLVPYPRDAPPDGVADPDALRDELLRGREETETEALAPHAEDGRTLPCGTCGQRPWGYGYCGMECERCAKEAEAT